MPRRIRSVSRWIALGAPFLTLAVLAGLWVWGSYSDWQLLAYLSSEGQADAMEQPAARRSPGRVELPSASAVRKAGIRLAPARVQALAKSVTANGMVDYEPSRHARLTARASGSVWRVCKEIGDPIHKGEVLALIEAAEVGKAKADFLLSLTQFQLRDRTLKQMRAAASSIPEQSLWAADVAQREARIRLFKDRQALLNLGLSIQIGDVADLSDVSRIRHMRQLGLPSDVRRELADTLTANLLPLTAPFDGQVVERNASTGEVVLMNHPKILFVVADIRRLRADLEVNPEDMAEVRVGQPATFRPNDGAPEASGRVSHISPEVDARTHRVRVHAEIPNLDGRLRPNTFGSGRIVVGERPNVVVVPAEAVQGPEGTTSLVFIRVSETVFEARPVRPGIRQGDLVEVSGVRAGEEVVTTGSFMLRSELLKDRIAGGD